MAINGASLYREPENVGFAVVGEFELSPADYSFDFVWAWLEQATGKVWAAFDTGCSCPTPFEDHTFPTDFTEIRTADEAGAFIKANMDEWDHPPEPPARFLKKVEEALEQNTRL